MERLLHRLKQLFPGVVRKVDASSSSYKLILVPAACMLSKSSVMQCDAHVINLYHEIMVATVQGTLSFGLYSRVYAFSGTKFLPSS